jgi:iron complex outermembrane receptor protein
MRADVIAVALGMALLGVSAGAAAQSAATRVSTNIPPEPLRPALRRLAQEFGFQIVYPSKDVANRRSPGVVGSYTLSEALQHALAGTGLTFRYIDVHTITIVPVSGQVAADPPAPGAAPGSDPKVGDPPAANSSGEAPSAHSTSFSGAGARAASDPPQADAGSSAGAATLHAIVVTGTRIRGVDTLNALPVQMLSRRDIRLSGATSVPQLLQQVTSTSSVGSVSSAQATGFTTGGIETVSLHGLGAARTLVLVNGLRMPVSTAGDTVDVGSIPLAAVQRVEVLENGASAVYGSDAIAGVVNFILKSDFQGLDASATIGSPTPAGGGTSENISVYAGIGSLERDRYNLGIGLEYDHKSPIMGSSRSYASRYSPGYGNDVTSFFAFPANVLIPPNTVLPHGGVYSPEVGNCTPTSLNDANYPTQCRFDNSPYDSLQPKRSRYSIILNGAYRLNDSTQLYGNVLFSQVRQTTYTQPVPLAFLNPLLPGNPYVAYLANLLATQYPGYHNPNAKPGQGAFLLPPTSPYYPTAWAAAHGLAGEPLNLIYRDFANGIRQTLDRTNTIRVVAGIKGNALGWHYNGSALFGQTALSDNLEHGWPLYSTIMPLLDSGVINPFGPTQDASALAQAQSDQFIGQDYTTKTSLTSVDGSASRKIAQLPTGPLRLAVGAELRRETYDYSPAAVLQEGNVGGLGGNSLPESASRTAQAAYFELNGYLLHSLQGDIAVRWDHYQAVGSTVNPQLWLHWKPLHWLQLRGSAGTGFRAPSLPDLYAPQTFSVTSNGTRDPLQCPVFDPNNPACSEQFTTVTGGNPNLQPEKSVNYTLGAVFQPTEGLRLDLDSFWIYLRNEIAGGGLPYSVILQNAQTANEFSRFVTRDSSGNIVSISQTAANLFKTYLSGLDINLSYDKRVGPGAVFVQANGAYFYKYAVQNYNGTWTDVVNQGLSSVGEAGGVIIRWRHTLTLGYRTASWELSVTQNYQEPYRDTPSTVTQVPRDVSAYDTINTQASYSGLRHFDFTIGVINLFNQNPPYTNYGSIANNFVGGYDLTYGDPRGRYVYATVRYHLR